MITKEKLANALKEEFERLKNHQNFNVIKQTKEYNLAIEYLETGKYPKYYDNYDLLYGCIEDIETMYLDYNIK